MNQYGFSLSGAAVVARGSGALFWPQRRLLCLSDLHFGKAGRIARRGGALLPPYDTRETLTRLDAEIAALDPGTVVCLGDSFDDPAAGDEMPEDERLWLARLMAGRDWIWIEGNHDPGPVSAGGRHLAALALGPLVFRHIATRQTGEISGHYHPKAVIAAKRHRMSRPCFLIDRARVILPAFGSYTGGLRHDDPAFAAIMANDALAVMTGKEMHAFPLFARKAAG